MNVVYCCKASNFVLLELIVPPYLVILSSASAYFLDFLHQPVRSYLQINVILLHTYVDNILILY